MNAFKVKQSAVSCSGHLLLGDYMEMDSDLKESSEGLEFFVT